MVVVGGEDITTVVPLASHLGNDVKAFIVLQELVIDICFYTLHAFDGLGRHPDDGLIHHFLTVGLEELNRRLPRIDQSSIGAFPSLLELSLKKITCLIGAVLGIVSPLILGAAQFLDYPLVMCQVLRHNHRGRNHHHNHCNNLLHTFYHRLPCCWGVGTILTGPFGIISS